MTTTTTKCWLASRTAFLLSHFLVLELHTLLCLKAKPRHICMWERKQRTCVCFLHHTSLIAAQATLSAPQQNSPQNLRLLVRKRQRGSVINFPATPSQYCMGVSAIGPPFPYSLTTLGGCGGDGQDVWRSLWDVPGHHSTGGSCCHTQPCCSCAFKLLHLCSWYCYLTAKTSKQIFIFLFFRKEEKLWKLCFPPLPCEGQVCISHSVWLNTCSDTTVVQFPMRSSKVKPKLPPAL